MTTSTTAETDNEARTATSPTASSTAIDDADRSWSASRREAVLVTALVALVAAVALFGLAFPGLLAPAVAIEAVGRRCFGSPVGDFPVRTDDIKMHPGMRIYPIQLGEFSL